MTVTICLPHLQSGDKTLELSLEDARTKITEGFAKGWIVAQKVMSAQETILIQVRKVEQVQDKSQIVMTPPIVGG